MGEKKRDYPRSADYHGRAKRVLPGGVSSNFRLGAAPFPMFFERAQGSRIWDVDGNEYLDYVLGMGPVILGHAHPKVNEAVEGALARGQLFAGQHNLELELAEEVCDVIPCADMVRFSSSGSEVVQAAIRLARAFSGRNRIVKFEGHYHGWFDNVFVSVHPDGQRMGNATSPARVVGSGGQDLKASSSVLVLPWNNPDVFRHVVGRRRTEIAAVIMEPIMGNTSMILPNLGYLEAVHDLCSENEIVLIFDEVITGFRVSLGGAQQLLGVTPDMACFAKALGNGYPISCLAGRRDLMELLATNQVVHGGTFNSNITSCAAGLATLRTLRENSQGIYSRLNELGSRLIRGLRELANELGCPLHVQGLPMAFHTTFTDQGEISDYRSHCRCDLDMERQFVCELLKQRIRITTRGTWFLSAAHTEEDVEVTLKAARKALEALAVPAAAIPRLPAS